MNGTAGSGRPPLTVAAWAGRTSVAEVLIENGTQLETKVDAW